MLCHFKIADVQHALYRPKLYLIGCSCFRDPLPQDGDTGEVLLGAAAAARPLRAPRPRGGALLPPRLSGQQSPSKYFCDGVLIFCAQIAGTTLQGVYLVELGQLEQCGVRECEEQGELWLCLLVR